MHFPAALHPSHMRNDQIMVSGIDGSTLRYKAPKAGRLVWYGKHHFSHVVKRVLVLWHICKPPCQVFGFGQREFNHAQHLNVSQPSRLALNGLTKTAQGCLSFANHGLATQVGAAEA